MPAVSYQGEDGCKECALNKRLEHIPEGYVTRGMGCVSLLYLPAVRTPGYEIFLCQYQFHIECII